VRFMPDLNECAWDHIIYDIALAHDAVSRSQRPRRFLSVNRSPMQSCLLRVPAEPFLRSYARHAAGGRKVVAPAHASARLVPKLSAEDLDPQRGVDENVGCFRGWRSNRMKHERRAVPQKKFGRSASRLAACD
jgi:hypothetical protein